MNDKLCIEYYKKKRKKRKKGKIDKETGRKI